MGFTSWSRQIADASLPIGRRFDSLHDLIGRHGPLGYQATWLFVEQLTGLDRRDPAILTPAVELLNHERIVRRSARQAHQDTVRRHRQSGHRLADGRVSEQAPPRWHGREQAGARVLLAHLLTTVGTEAAGQPAALTAMAAAAELAAGAPETEVDLAHLQHSLVWARRGDDWVHRRIEALLGQIVIAQWGALELGQRWQVVPDRAELVRWLRPAYARWRTDPRAGRELVTAASRLVAHGRNDAALVQLSRTTGRPAQELVTSVLAEHDLTSWQQLSDQRWALEVRAREGLSGRATWTQVADWAASTIGTHGESEAQGFVALASALVDQGEGRRPVLDWWASLEATRLVVGGRRDPHGPPLPPVAYQPPEQTWRPPSRIEQVVTVVSAVLTHLERHRHRRG